MRVTRVIFRIDTRMIDGVTHDPRDPVEEGLGLI